MTRVRVCRKGNPTRPWCVFHGDIVLYNAATHAEAFAFAHRFATHYEGATS